MVKTAFLTEVSLLLWLIMSAGVCFAENVDTGDGLPTILDDYRMADAVAELLKPFKSDCQFTLMPKQAATALRNIDNELNGYCAV